MRLLQRVITATHTHYWSCCAAAAFINVALLAKISFWKYLFGTLQLWDFDVYYLSAQAVWQGQNMYHLPWMQIPAPPLVLIPYLPIAILPFPVARFLMTVVSLVAVGTTGWLLARMMAPKQKILIGLLICAGLLLAFPTRFNFDVGQPNLVIMAGVAWLLTAPRAKSQAANLAAIIVLKTNYLFILLGLVKSNFTLVLAALGILAVAGAVSVPLLPPTLYTEYSQQHSGDFIFSRPVTTNLDYYNQSLKATLARLQLNDLYFVLWFCLGLAIAVSVFKHQDTILGVIGSLLLSPLLWQHYVPVLYPVIAVMAYRLWQARRWSWQLVFATGLLVLHVPVLHHQALQPFPAILASHFFIGIVWLAYLQVRLRRYTLPSIL